MNEDILKSLINVKLQAMDVITDMLPSDLQEPVKKIQKNCIKIIGEVAQEYMERSDRQKEGKKLKTIEIEGIE